MSEDRSDNSNGAGASNLLGLFAPPTPPSNPASAKKAAGNSSNNAGYGRESFILAPNASDIILEEDDNENDDDAAPAGQTYQSFDMLRNYDDIDSARADKEAPPGSISYMMGLFSSNAPPLADLSSGDQRETTPLLSSGGIGDQFSSWKDTNPTEGTPKTNLRTRKMYSASDTENGGAPRSTRHIRLPSLAMPVIEETTVTSSTSSLDPLGPSMMTSANLRELLLRGVDLAKQGLKAASKPTTLIGAFMYLLYHVVFCLAIGAAINRPHGTTSLLGLMTKMAALGSISASASYWWFLSGEIPALYPTVDLFLAPFLANLAVVVDEALYQDKSILPEDNDAIFLATFGLLTAIGVICSGTLLSLSGVFRLANLGSFLPFPVICGFFSAVGILTWMLSVTIDTGGKSVVYIIKSGDPQLVLSTLLHHVPSLVVASVMKYLGPKHPFFVIMVVFVTIALFYTVMGVRGVSMDRAKEMGWLWSREELVYTHSVSAPLPRGLPPAPFGVLRQLFTGAIHWGAVYDGMSTVLALAFLYVIRCSVHGAALKKNLVNLARTVRGSEAIVEPVQAPSPKQPQRPMSINARARQFSEAVDIEAVMLPQLSKAAVNGGLHGYSSEPAVGEVHFIHAKPSNITLKQILTPYGFSQFLAALFGGFAATPAVAVSPTMFSLGADGLAPQIGSILLLFVFYMTDFQLVEYIPKPAFSSMLVLASIDMIYTWFYKSWFKIKDKSEWLVVPAIVLCTFVFDLLSAVFLGIAFSTFIFVGSFFRSGVVKYVANGSVIRSTIERPYRKCEWLVENGDFIQVLVLQNYLFFGNASAVYSYIATMFQRNEQDELESRKPKYLCMDLALVTGMDTSTVDIFTEIRNLCSSNHCKLFVSGQSFNLRGILALGGFKPETTERSKRNLRFFQNLDAAIGKAEDMLLESDCDDPRDFVSPTDNRVRLLSEGDFGFRTALRHIDEEHGDNFSTDLVGWQIHTTLVDLNPGERLYKEGKSGDLERGLFFIESGVLKIEHDATASLTRTGTLRSSLSMRESASSDSTAGINTTDTLTRIQAMEYSNILEASRNEEARTFRLARIGPGWIAGTLEAVSGRERPGQHVAVTPCRLHHLSFATIVEVEKSNPALVLHLYKLLAYMLARRQEATIGQLATLHSIMTSPVQRKHHRKIKQ